MIVELNKCAKIAEIGNQMEDHMKIETEVVMISTMLVIVMKNKTILHGRESLHPYLLDLDLDLGKEVGQP
jgi:hypothetical protein